MSRNLFVAAVCLFLTASTAGAMDIFEAIWHGETDSLQAIMDADEKARFQRERDDAGHYPLHVAVLADQPEMFQAMLVRGGDINQKDKNHLTPLLYAVLTQNTEFLDLILNLGANVNAQTRHGDTGLHLAIARKNSEIAGQLLERNAQVNVGNDRGRTPLHVAVTVGSPEMIRFLMSRNAAPNQLDNDGVNPLHLAVIQGGPALVGLLVDQGAEKDARTGSSFDLPAGREATPIHLAVLYNRSRTLQTLIAAQPNTGLRNRDGFTPLMVAIEQGNLAMIDLLLKLDVVVDNERGFSSPMDQALERHDYALVKKLLANGYSPNRVNSKGVPPLNEAIREEYEEIVKLLLEHGADVEGTETSEYPIDVALKVRNLTIIDHLIQAGLFLEAQNERGQTPLRVAVDDEDVNLVRLLCRRNADVNEFTERGELTLLQTAIKDGNLDIVRILIEHGADVTYGESLIESPIGQAMEEGCMFLATVLQGRDVMIDQRDVEGNSYLHLAAEMNDPRLISLLLDAGSNVDGANQQGWTALHTAARKGNAEAVEMLLAFGANINAYDTSGHTPADVARSEAAELLFLYNGRRGVAAE